jgi:hypothetical protein
MPHTTCEYGFEWKILAVVQEMILSRTGSLSECLIVLDGGGEVNSLFQIAPSEGWSSAKKSLLAEGRPYIFFDPFDAPDYAWLDWSGVDRPTMERLVGRPFEESDFVPVRRLRRAGQLDPPKSYPESWGVMF